MAYIPEGITLTTFSLLHTQVLHVYEPLKKERVEKRMAVHGLAIIKSKI